jgi:hypothetical protein
LSGSAAADPLDDGIEMPSHPLAFLPTLHNAIGRYLGAIHLSMDFCFDVPRRRDVGIKFNEEASNYAP